MIEGDGLVRLVAVQCFLRQRRETEDQAADSRPVAAGGMLLARGTAPAAAVSRSVGLHVRHGNGEG